MNRGERHYILRRHWTDKRRKSILYNRAEGEGFEPSNAYALPVFKTC